MGKGYVVITKLGPAGGADAMVEYIIRQTAVPANWAHGHRICLCPPAKKIVRHSRHK
ncbi:hypothetical protein SBA4_6290008 [Candidatus Sulfopaludibacter sp. SbA4]|nr:hypothetical protein SBA4_6290008 [Candidatus Sulfopaludibacter sp. SbA4]